MGLPSDKANAAPEPIEAHAELHFRVRWHECDPQGLVFNANYLAYFDMAYTEMWRLLCGRYQVVVDLGFETVLAEATVKYLAPGTYDDEIVASARVTHLGQTSLIVDFDVSREETSLAAGSLRYVFTDASTGLKKPVDGELRELLAGLVAAS